MASRLTEDDLHAARARGYLVGIEHAERLAEIQHPLWAVIEREITRLERLLWQLKNS